MRDVTHKLLDEIRDLPLFSRLGQPYTHQSVTSWDNALELCAGDIWQSVPLMAKNRVAGKVRALDWHRAQTWNPICAELRPQVDQIVESAVARVAADRKVTIDFRGCVSWDLLIALMETEFTDVFPAFFQIPRLFPIYRAGHFPCGWSGPMLDTYWSSSDDPLPDAQILIY